MAEEPKVYVRKGYPDRYVYTAADQVAAEWDGFTEYEPEGKAEKKAEAAK